MNPTNISQKIISALIPGKAGKLARSHDDNNDDDDFSTYDFVFAKTRFTTPRLKEEK